MHIKSMMSGAALAVGLMLSGCGVDSTLDAEPDLATRKDELPPCEGDQQYSRVFYSDAAMTQEVGRWRCFCGEGSAWVSGHWAGVPYSQIIEVIDC
ncbi:hypothetical protein OV208_05870 [Corallococcus sp. bb12-1]|uniref:hypothetical protein n=1 Tax=Corallococcus sp. bb12-1 TaxID=2996784 RepID=UPI00226D403B|nr:hypothetical protein [Corallococcus sp. bb12-1]MCY1040845.1 hypothetical protein [Corallococcus sp. bb12-1]